MDQQKYINTYVDKSVGMLHEYVTVILQLRTQLHLANDLIQEKDQVISTFENERRNFQTNTEELNKSVQNAKSWEEQYNAMKNKASHIDTLTGQINEMKNALLAKNNEVDDLKRQVDALIRQMEQMENKEKQTEELKILIPKKVINTKNSKPTILKKVEEIKEESDDF